MNSKDRSTLVATLRAFTMLGSPKPWKCMALNTNHMAIVLAVLFANVVLAQSAQVVYFRSDSGIAQGNQPLPITLNRMLLWCGRLKLLLGIQLPV